MANGQAYRRWADVEAEMQRMSRLPQSDWLAEAEHLQSETLVFLIRQTRRASQELYGRLVQELSRRMVRIANRWAQGLDEITTEEIVSQVEIKVLQLVLADTPSRQSDFLEGAFGKAVERFTINAVEKHNNSVLGRRGDLVAPVDPENDEEFEEIEGPIELAPDDRPGPEAVFLQLQDEARRPELIRKACDAVKDPRRLEAVILHYVDGWPVASRDPNQPDLERHFHASSRQIKRWIAAALKAMRNAVGDEK